MKSDSAASSSERDPLEGLPPDLAATLRDQSIIVPQDAGVFELIGKWASAPSSTASADKARCVRCRMELEWNAVARLWDCPRCDRTAA